MFLKYINVILCKNTFGESMTKTFSDEIEYNYMCINN